MISDRARKEKKKEMATYVIGDLQGCFLTFQALLKQIKWTHDDRLWLVGDLVNRGPHSVQVLEWVMEHQNQVKVVLGNHDLHLLACLNGATPSSKDTFQECLTHSRADSFKEWLRFQPLMYEEANRAMLHAGFCPAWSWKDVQKRAQSIQAVLQSTEGLDLFTSLHQNHLSKLKSKHRSKSSLDSSNSALKTKTTQDQYTESPQWMDDVGWFTRVRTVSFSSDLQSYQRNEKFKGALSEISSPNLPWFTVFEEHRLKQPFSYPNTIYFGHWAALGIHQSSSTFSLDTGCIWGRYLSAVRLEDGALFQHPTLEKAWTPKNQRRLL